MKLHLVALYRNLVAGTRLALFLPVRPYDYRAAALDYALLIAFNFLVWIAAAAIRTGMVGDFDSVAIPIYLGGIPLVIELEQPVEQFVLRRRTHGESHALRRLPVVVIEAEIAPAVCIADRFVKCYMDFS